MLFEKVVRFYQAKNLLRYETIPEFNDSFINFVSNKESIDRDFAYLKEKPILKDNPLAYGYPKPEETELDIEIVEPTKLKPYQEQLSQYKTKILTVNSNFNPKIKRFAL